MPGTSPREKGVDAAIKLAVVERSSFARISRYAQVAGHTPKGTLELIPWGIQGDRQRVGETADQVHCRLVAHSWKFQHFYVLGAHFLS
jgi:hypothetical protein